VLKKEKKENIICGRHVASMWRITTNQKLREVIKVLDIVAENEKKNCNGGGHIARTDHGELLSYLRVMQMEKE
jgi:hypothetical protein